MQILNPQPISKVFYSRQKSPSSALIVGSIFLCIVSFILTVMLLLFYPYGANYGEAPILNQALHIAAGQNIYKPSLQSSPYVVTNYTPIYPLLISGIHQLTHLPLFLTGRAISILAALASSFIIRSMVCRLFNSPTAGNLSAALFLGHPYVGLWSGLVRVDSLALAFSLAGLWIIFFRWRSYTWLVLAIVCLLAAIYTRQTYLLAAPLACTIWLFHNDRKRGFTFVSLLVLLGLVIFLALNTVTHGGFYRHIVVANVNPYAIGRLLSMWTLFIFTAPVLLFLSIFTIRKSIRHPLDPFFVWGLLPYTGGAFLIALTAGKIGSDINYFLELVVASVLWTAGILSIKSVRLTSFLLVFHAIWTFAFNGLLFQIPLVGLWTNISEVNALARQVQEAAHKGPVLADDRLDLVVLAGQEIEYQPFEYTQLYTAGLWDITPFTQEIASHKFSLILIRSAYRYERWPIPIFEAIQRNYTCTMQTKMLVCQP